MDAFDADVLIYAANAGHPLGRRIRPLIPIDPPGGPDEAAGVGSMLLIPELMIKPSRQDAQPEAEALTELLVRLHLLPVDEPTSRLATQFGAVYGLKTVDAVHLATAVLWREGRSEAPVLVTHDGLLATAARATGFATAGV